MKLNFKFLSFNFLSILFMFNFAISCKDEEPIKDEQPVKKLLIPVLTTSEVTSLKFNSAISGGNITSDGGSPVTERGVCWSLTATPTVTDNKIIGGIGIGVFTSSITDLTSETTYYVRAYATNSVGTGYGNVYQFTTLQNPTAVSTVLIPAGTFTMGSPTNEVSRDEDETPHSVTLSAFRMSKYEITNKQFAAFLNIKSINSSGYYTKGAYPQYPLIYASGFRNSSYDFGLKYSGSEWIPVAGYENAPVINVTWYGATEFATYVGGKLPTEAQWEYACRAGTTTPFNTGNFLTNLQANYLWEYPYNDGTNTVKISLEKTQSVGTYSANAYGLYDMHGNVDEWCSDKAGDYPTTSQTNPTGGTTLAAHVIRGGNFRSEARHCRSSNRDYEDPYLGDYHIGFRVVFVP